MNEKELFLYYIFSGLQWILKDRFELRFIFHGLRDTLANFLYDVIRHETDATFLILVLINQKWACVIWIELARDSTRSVIVQWDYVHFVNHAHSSNCFNQWLWIFVHIRKAGICIARRQFVCIWIHWLKYMNTATFAVLKN